MTPQLLHSMLLVLAASVIGSFGAVFLKFGSARITRNPLSFLNPQLAFGVALYLGSSVFYFLGIKGGQLSILYPLVSLGYIWTLLWARLFFQESFTKQKCAGLALILAGVVLVGMGAS
ncbi:MAG TPA: EamA family transporter [Bryobacteraceae bacterium]|nr:EamA family transporter [Bryobacteraceae bacterium]